MPIFLGFVVALAGCLPSSPATSWRDLASPSSPSLWRQIPERSPFPRLAAVDSFADCRLQRERVRSPFCCSVDCLPRCCLCCFDSCWSATAGENDSIGDPTHSARWIRWQSATALRMTLLTAVEFYTEFHSNVFYVFQDQFLFRSSKKVNYT